MSKKMSALLICIILLIVTILIFIYYKHKHTYEKDIKGSEDNLRVKMFQSYYQFSCNVYIISSDKGSILIDPGHYDEEIKDYIEEIGGLDAILLTHGHWDHTYGLDDLKKDYPNVPVYMSEYGYDFLQDPYLNGSSINGFDEYVETEVSTIPEGELDIASYKIDVINTPGHCRGCVIYYFKDENVLFTGDTILKSISVPIRPTGSKEEEMTSMKKFMNLGYKEDTPIFPGHGDNTTYGYLLENNPDIKEAKKWKK